MSKIFKAFDAVWAWFCKISSADYARVLVSLLCTFILGHIIHFFNTPMDIAGACGAVAVFTLGFFGEWIDQFRDDAPDFSHADIFWKAIGCLLGVIVTIL